MITVNIKHIAIIINKFDPLCRAIACLRVNLAAFIGHNPVVQSHRFSRKANGWAEQKYYEDRYNKVFHH